ncbi:DMT family transporter [Paenibacillus oenotherae]|uniref:DMT family transporter n=1 Tax=Paenibacillus oenotherae TaxID=1435645 RepID=A0ABS7DDR3_9BACL|nr:DMT family transporter [Paenibacillus oenotherae]MBW7477627.1 DMT family transporter [Paenibacillus oenotherae]
MNSSPSRAYAAAILTAIIIGFSFIFVKLALTESNPADLLAHRFTISFIAILVCAAIGRLRFAMKLKDVLLLLPLAALSPTLFFALQAFGLLHISSSEAGIVQAAIPVFTMMLAGAFLKERTSMRQKLSILLSMAGMGYILAMKGIRFEASDTIGFLLILLSTLSVAAYNVLARKLIGPYKITDITFVMIAIGFLSFNIMAVLEHTSEGTLENYFQSFSSPMFVLSIVYLGVLSSLVTTFLSNYALSRLEASRVSVFNNLSTLLTMFAGTLLLKEQLLYYHYIGAILIILGIVGTNYSQHRKRASIPSTTD